MGRACGPTCPADQVPVSASGRRTSQRGHGVAAHRRGGRQGRPRYRALLRQEGPAPVVPVQKGPSCSGLSTTPEGEILVTRNDSTLACYNRAGDCPGSMTPIQGRRLEPGEESGGWGNIELSSRAVGRLSRWQEHLRGRLLRPHDRPGPRGESALESRVRPLHERRRREGGGGRPGRLQRRGSRPRPGKRRDGVDVPRRRARGDLVYL